MSSSFVAKSVARRGRYSILVGSRREDDTCSAFIHRHTYSETQIMRRQMMTNVGGFTIIVIVCFAAAASTVNAGLCPDLASMRSQEVANELDMSRANGLWYEIAYHDIAQVGAKCQRFNNTYDPETGNIEQKFDAKYGPIPFQQTYKYEVTDKSTKGLYVSYLEGAKALLKLPAVIVDVRTSDDTRSLRGVTSDDNEQYAYYTQFICKEEAGIVKVTELRISARTKEVSDETLESLKSSAIALGVPEEIVSSLKVSSQDCA